MRVLAFDIGIKNQNNKELILHQMEIIKKEHTYLNRVKGIIKIIEKII